MRLQQLGGRFLHTNVLGSNIVSTDDNQNVLVRCEYDVFGAIRNETGTSDNRRKFTGKEFDADSNLYYYAARYYVPYIARFTQRNAAMEDGSWYAYIHNKPDSEYPYLHSGGYRPVCVHGGIVG